MITPTKQNTPTYLKERGSHNEPPRAADLFMFELQQSG